MKNILHIAAAGVVALVGVALPSVNPAPPPLFVPAAAETYHIADVDKKVEPPTLEEIADAAALEHGVPTTTLRNLVWSESRWSTSTVGGLGELGLVQILPEDNPDITAAEAVDPVFSLNWAAGRLAAGEEWRWTVCSCVKMVRVFLPTLPRGDADSFVPNGPPQVGGIVIYKYPNGVSHIAFIKSFLKDGSGWVEVGANLEPCLSYERVGTWTDLGLVGFAAF